LWYLIPEVDHAAQRVPRMTLSGEGSSRGRRPRRVARGHAEDLIVRLAGFFSVATSLHVLACGDAFDRNDLRLEMPAPMAGAAGLAILLRGWRWRGELAPSGAESVPPLRRLAKRGTSSGSRARVRVGRSIGPGWFRLEPPDPDRTNLNESRPLSP
jgi:hypothetical protein